MTVRKSIEYFETEDEVMASKNKDFLELNDDDLKSLNLFPLDHIKDVRKILTKKTAYMCEFGYMSKDFRHLLLTSEPVCKYAEHMNVLEEKTFDSLDDFSIHDFIAIGIRRGETIEKYEWLKQYLAGETDGKYQKNDKIYLNLQEKIVRYEHKYYEEVKKRNELIEENKRLKAIEVKAIKTINKSNELLEMLREFQEIAGTMK